MTVRIVQKNSVAEDKRPTAGQLANGEIAVNLHEAGAFLSIKDTAGNIQQVGGVKVSQNSPANPVKGTFWLDSDNNTLFIYDGTQWRGVTGGGGGGGGSINLAEGDAINITQAGSTYTINVVAGAGITLANDNVAVELDTDVATVGLKMVGAGDAGKLSAKVATASTLGSVKVDGTTIEVDNAGEISAKIPNPLTYKGNVNPTTEDSGPDNISSYTGSPGDAYTCSWGGTNVEGTLGTTPADKNWANVIKGGDTTATLGDLLIINSGDGQSANQWTLVKTGTVDSGASIDVGDGTTASFPPASPQEGDVWYNLDDGRTYVYITDNSGDTVWVDISPQGNQTLWKKDSGNDIEPQTSTDDLKIPGLAGGTATTGTTLVMADTNGVLVSNAAGTGLEISNGSLQIDADDVPLPGGGDGNGDAGFWTRTDSTNTLKPRTAGDKVTVVNSSDAAVIELKPDGSSEFAGGDFVITSSGAFVGYHNKSTTDNSISTNLGNGGTTGPRMYLTSSTASSTEAALLVRDSPTDPSTGKISLYYDGSATFAGGNITLNANGSAEFAGNIQATDYIEISRSTSGSVFQCNQGTTPTFKVFDTGTIAIGFDLNSGSNIGLNSDGSANFAGTITTQGGAGGPYVAIGETITFNTEADNPANYTTTTDSEGNETQVYNGPTLDVKEVLLDLQQRVADRDAVIADLTARIAALEGAP